MLRCQWACYALVRLHRNPDNFTIASATEYRQYSVFILLRLSAKEYLGLPISHIQTIPDCSKVRHHIVRADQTTHLVVLSLISCQSLFLNIILVQRCQIFETIKHHIAVLQQVNMAEEAVASEIRVDELDGIIRLPLIITMQVGKAAADLIQWYTWTWRSCRLQSLI